MQVFILSVLGTFLDSKGFIIEFTSSRVIWSKEKVEISILFNGFRLILTILEFSKYWLLSGL